MNILYMITIYNPDDVNKTYLDFNGYAYKNIRLVNLIKRNSKHNIDMVVSAFGVGPKTVEHMKTFRHEEGIDLKIIVGPDMSYVVGNNKTILELTKNKKYDYRFNFK